MKITTLLIVSISFCLLNITLVQAQININKAKNLLKSKNQQAKINDNPCGTNGTVKITEGNPANTIYKNVLKQLDLAESFISRGIIKSASKNIANTEKYLSYVLKKEPKADLSEVCKRLKKLKSNSENSAGDDDYFTKNAYFVSLFYDDETHGVYPENYGFEYHKFIDGVKKIDRNEVLAKAKVSNDRKAKELIVMLNDYSAFIDRQGLVNYLMDVLDQSNNESSNALAQKAKTIKQVAIGLKKLAGSNSDVDRLIEFADKQLSKADSALTNIYSSDIHKEYINQVVFTKLPFAPSNEGSIEINPVFKTGDAVYATIYLSASIKDAIDSWKGYGKGGTMALRVKDGNGDFLNRRFEAWEVSSYSNYEVSIPDDINKEQTIVQFVLIPNKEANIKSEISYNNITPILMVRGLSLESERLKEYKVEVSSSGQVTGPITYKGNFKIDLASGEGPSYYNQVENQNMEVLLKSVALPTAKINNSSLESQLLSEMKRQGFHEEFKKTYIQTNWQLFELLLETPYKEMKASFTYTTTKGKCGWQTYSFRSFKTGSGWSTPQKWGGADQRQRLSCKKLK